VPGLTSEQWQTLVKMLSGSQIVTGEKMTGKPVTWIIDMGASNHMTGRIGDLCDLHDIAPCPVGLPNGSSVVATKEGSIFFDGNLRLKNVLYVPGLTCNLIYVSQLTDDHDCFVQFTKHLCVIQDHTSRMLISADKRQDRLYFFRSVPRVVAMKADTNTSLEFWQKRMGHPSLPVRKLLPRVSCKDSKSSLNKICDVCQKAKHCRDKFSDSEHKALEIFELIHCDLWGPYRTQASCRASHFLTIADDFSRAVWV